MQDLEIACLHTEYLKCASRLGLYNDNSYMVVQRTNYFLFFKIYISP